MSNYQNWIKTFKRQALTNNFLINYQLLVMKKMKFKDSKMLIKKINYWSAKFAQNSFVKVSYV